MQSAGSCLTCCASSQQNLRCHLPGRIIACFRQGRYAAMSFQNPAADPWVIQAQHKQHSEAAPKQGHSKKSKHAGRFQARSNPINDKQLFDGKQLQWDVSQTPYTQQTNDQTQQQPTLPTLTAVSEGAAAISALPIADLPVTSAAWGSVFQELDACGKRVAHALQTLLGELCGSMDTPKGTPPPSATASTQTEPVFGTSGMAAASATASMVSDNAADSCASAGHAFAGPRHTQQAATAGREHEPPHTDADQHTAYQADTATTDCNQVKQGLCQASDTIQLQSEQLAELQQLASLCGKAQAGCAAAAAALEAQPPMASSVSTSLAKPETSSTANEPVGNGPLGNGSLPDARALALEMRKRAAQLAELAAHTDAMVQLHSSGGKFSAGSIQATLQQLQLAGITPSSTPSSNEPASAFASVPVSHASPSNVPSAQSAAKDPDAAAATPGTPSAGSDSVDAAAAVAAAGSTQPGSGGSATLDSSARRHSFQTRTPWRSLPNAVQELARLQMISLATYMLPPMLDRTARMLLWGSAAVRIAEAWPCGREGKRE